MTIENMKIVPEVNLEHQRIYRFFIKIYAGMAGYIDRLILKSYHMDDHPTCKNIYDTQLPYDPEGREIIKQTIDL